MQRKRLRLSSVLVSAELLITENNYKMKNSEWPKYDVRELDEGRRYLSTRVGSGFDLMIFTTVISEASIEEHEELLDSKVNDFLKRTDSQNDGNDD